MSAKTYALRFTAGRYMGGEFPLRPNREIVVGRGSEFDMVLDEDMVSRRHAKIATYHGQIVLQDLKSTNGTFVNGERVTVARLKLGDKVVIGTSIMEVVETGRGPVPQQVQETPAPAPPGGLPPPPAPLPPLAITPGAPSPAIMSTIAAQPTVAPRPTIDRSEGMSGRFPDDVAVPELVELFTGGQRTGVLVLSDAGGAEGRIFFRDGRVYYATIARPTRPGESAVELDPLKSLNRMLGWQGGDFRMDALNPPPAFENEIAGDTRELLVEGLRQYDELQRYAAHLPERHQRLALVTPLEARLSALSPEALDTLQVVINCGEMGLVLDYSEASDLETSQDVLYLMQNGYIAVA